MTANGLRPLGALACLVKHAGSFAARGGVTTPSGRPLCKPPFTMSRVLLGLPTASSATQVPCSNARSCRCRAALSLASARRRMLSPILSNKVWWSCSQPHVKGIYCWDFQKPPAAAGMQSWLASQSAARAPC